MKKTIIIGLYTILIIVSTAFGFVGHYSTQIMPGNFQSGHYNFPGIFSVNTNKFFVNGTSGYIGIGTNNPTSIFTVIGNTNITGKTTINGNLTTNGLIETTTGGIKFPDGTIQTTAATTNPSGTYYYPTDIKLTNETHDGNFGGYAGIKNWIQTHNCSGYHVCDATEITRAAQNGITIPNYGIYNSGIYSDLPNLNINDCRGWTHNDNVYGMSIWYGYPKIGYCDSANYVMCCK